MSIKGLFAGGPSAILSEDGAYRYTLVRGLNPCGAGVVNFIMLNPSTADATRDDPTIRRCVGFARSWGYGDLVVTNLFAFRATNPAELRAAADPVGPENDRHILEQARKASTVVCAWGAYHGHIRARKDPALLRRDLAVCDALRAEGVRLVAVRSTADGHPSHPLYCPASLETVPFDPK